MTKFISVGCLHGHHQNENAVSVFHEFCKDFDPNNQAERICLGDMFDFGPLRKGASTSERCEGLEQDLQAGLEFLRTFKPVAITWGNHELRLFQNLDNDANGMLRDACRKVVRELEAELDAIGCKVRIPWSWDQVYHVGPVGFRHGVAFGVHAAAQACQLYRDRYIVQTHAHSLDYYRGKAGNESWVSGCMLNLDIPYARANSNTARWANAWNFGHVFDSGAAQINFATKSDDDLWRIGYHGKEYSP